MAQLAGARYWITAMLTLGAVHLLTAAPAAAQCVLCYVSASGSGDRGIRTLQIGILILMIPTVAILASLVWMVARRRNGDGAVIHGAETDPKWEEELASLRGTSEPQNLSPRA